jgi:hypothetical protein
VIIAGSLCCSPQPPSWEGKRSQHLRQLSRGAGPQDTPRPLGLHCSRSRAEKRLPTTDHLRPDSYLGETGVKSCNPALGPGDCGQLPKAAHSDSPTTRLRPMEERKTPERHNRFESPRLQTDVEMRST